MCGECRQPKGKPHRIYLDLEDLVDNQVALVVDGLNAINMESSPSAIESFNRAVLKLCQKPNADPAVSVSSLGFLQNMIVTLIRSLTSQRVLLEAAADLKERVAPFAEQNSELINQNEALNRQVEDLESQKTIFLNKLKKANLSMQTRNEETKRLRFALNRQMIANEGEVTEKKEMQAQLDGKDREVSHFFSPPSSSINF